MATTSDARKRREESDPVAAVLRALQRVYGDAERVEAAALRDALEDEGLLR